MLLTNSLACVRLELEKPGDVFFDKILLKVIGSEATMACQGDQLCAGLKAGIDCAVHGVQDIWDEILTKDDSECLLVDAKSAFNNIN